VAITIVERVRESPRLQRRIFRSSVALLFVGVAALVFAVTWNPPADESGASGPSVADQTLAAQRHVPVSSEVTAIATKWILGAVNRHDLVSSYPLTHPDLRGTMTLSEWKSGDIPVIPYPVDKNGIAGFHVRYSYAKEALLEVRLNPEKSASGDFRPLTFFIGLVKVPGPQGDHWVVNYWAPRYRPPVRLFAP
jgi:hypothetical protein